ncbi:hypothetical protein [Xanthomonas sp. A1809]|uniref:hypothetical protein n=1 Tax=Xanthomonas sp. A1809 TaxID=2821275 RepID=UPI001ADA7F8E|nr:hypothetical protein [Xanthomonas sp. A1809]MBO9855302.1 hypothetical protein [Xanthomonas sp. A1809]
MGMILPASPALGKNPRTVDNAFNLQVMQMIREPERRAHTVAWQAWVRWLGDGQVAVEVNLEPLFRSRSG